MKAESSMEDRFMPFLKAAYLEYHILRELTQRLPARLAEYATSFARQRNCSHEGGVRCDPLLDHICMFGA